MLTSADDKTWDTSLLARSRSGLTCSNRNALGICPTEKGIKILNLAAMGAAEVLRPDLLLVKAGSGF